MTVIRFPNGHITGKYYSIQIPKNRARGIVLWKKNLNVTHRIIYFNNVLVQRANEQKHLDIFLHEKLNFKCHIDKDLHYWK